MANVISGTRLAVDLFRVMLILSGLVVGLLLGVVLHRGDFCMHSALRELLGGRPGPNLRAYLVALALQLLAVNALASLRWLAVPLPPVAVVGAVLGGVVFGMGMVLAKG